MATSLVFKVRDEIGVLVASCKLLRDAAMIATCHGAGSKLVHMHLGVLATVDARDNHELLRQRAVIVLDRKREERRQEYERTLQAEAERRAR